MPLLPVILKGVWAVTNLAVTKGPSIAKAFRGVAKVGAIANVGSALYNEANDDKNVNYGNEGYKKSPISSSSVQSASAVGSSKTNNPTLAASTATANSNYRMQPRQNPLGNYSSYSYQTTLYMSTPDAINRFINEGVFDKNDDHYIIAQSGGIGLDEKRGLTDSGKVGPGEKGLDYFLEDLEIKMLLTGYDGSPTVGTEIKFKIVEPTGFNLFKKLEQLSGQINQISDIIKNKKQNPQGIPEADPAPMQQFYLIGIRFYGYDASGNLASSSYFQKKNQFYNPNKPESRSTIDEYATYERFFTFTITEVNYTVSGKIVTYDFIGTPISNNVGHGVKFGLLNSVNTIVAGNVEEAIGNSDSQNKKGSGTKSLLDCLNEQEEQKTSKNKASEEISYSVKWLPGTEKLRQGKLLDDPIYKNNVPAADVKKPSDATVKASERAQSVNTDKKQLPLQSGNHIMMIMDQIMAKSSYVSEALILQNNEAIESESKPTSDTAEISWYSINPVVKIKGRDVITRDWAYDITYYIQMQRIEYVRAYYVKNRSLWLGVHKKYQYFLTGENTEIVSFEQTFNNQFYLLQSITTDPSNINVNNLTPAQVQGGTPDNTIASRANRGSLPEADAAIRMNSPADLAEAKIRILGDPDYITSNVGGIVPHFDLGGSEFFRRYNISMETLNPYNNQIWIAINFRGSTDYKEDGTLETLPVDFYGVIEKRTNSKKEKELLEYGVIYRVIDINNYFNDGKFTQELSLIMVSANDLNFGDNNLLEDSNRDSAKKMDFGDDLQRIRARKPAPIPYPGVPMGGQPTRNVGGRVIPVGSTKLPTDTWSISDDDAARMRPSERTMSGRVKSANEPAGRTRNPVIGNQVNDRLPPNTN